MYYEPSCRNDAELGRHIAHLSGDLLEKAPRDIKDSGLDNTNVLYNELIADPVATVKKIYQDFGWTVSAEYEAKLNAYLAEDSLKREEIKKKNSGASGAALHTYSPEEFSLTHGELCSGKFAAYADMYRVPAPKKN